MRRCLCWENSGHPSLPVICQLMAGSEARCSGWVPLGDPQASVAQSHPLNSSIKAASSGLGLPWMCPSNPSPGWAAPQLLTATGVQDSQKQPRPHPRRKGFVWKWEMCHSPARAGGACAGVKPRVTAQELSPGSCITPLGLSSPSFCQLLLFNHRGKLKAVEFEV